MGRTSLISVSVVVVLTFAILTCQPVRATETVYIRADGSIDPASAPISTSDNITYLIFADIFDSIVIERDSIILDGDGHKVQGSGSGCGVDLTFSDYSIVKNMKIENFYRGIASGYSHDNVIVDNDVKNNGDGIVLVQSSNCLIAGNRITVCFFQDGIYLAHSEDSQVIRNEINGNKRAGVVIASSSTNNTVSENNISSNVYAGIIIDWSSNKFFHNNLIDNGIQAVNFRADLVNIWDDGYPSGGNYWSDYTGIDSDGDGIGETPYIIDENNRDNYPLTNRRMFVIPVLPFGGLAAALMMFATLGIYKVRVRRKASSQLPRALLG